MFLCKPDQRLVLQAHCWLDFIPRQAAFMGHQSNAGANCGVACAPLCQKILWGALGRV
jgi:hypothetical protein